MMRSRVLVACGLVAGLWGCGSPVAIDGNGGGSGGGTGGGAGGGSGVTYGADGGVVTGLPCDVQTVLSGTCWSCHGLTPMPGAPRLVMLDDLKAPSTRDPAQTNAQRAVVRMQDPTTPMPPGLTVTVPASDVATVSAWVSANYQGTACETAVVPTNDTLLGAAPTCTSKASWPSNQQFNGNRRMNPGLACISCHVGRGGGEAPVEFIAGTVYPTGHEPDFCNALLPAGVSVVITGANGTVSTLVPNSVGNFEANFTIALPYTAKVVVNGKERPMLAAQTVGDCNSCHTQSGLNGAPGRITVPMP